MKKKVENFTHKKTYPDGTVKYTRVANWILESKKPNEELNKSKHDAFMKRLHDYRTSPDSFEYMVSLDPYFQKQMLSMNQTMNETIKRSQRRVRSQIQDYILCNEFTWFVTLTDKDQLTDRTLFAKKLKRWVSKLRERHFPDLEYIIILEQHKSGAWHAHALFNDVVKSGMDFALERRTKNGLVESYNFRNWRFGFSVAEKVRDREKISNYLLKYITKDLFYEKHKQSYYVSEGLLLPEKEQGNYYVEINDIDNYYENDTVAIYKDNKHKKNSL